MIQPLTLELFKERSVATHGEKYDYSKSIYVNMTTKIIVKCKKCGTETSVYPQNHLNGHGCKPCSDKKPRKSINKFEFECNIIHNDKYKYFQDYAGNTKKIKIHCLQCKNDFYQRAALHIAGAGCTICFRSNNPNNKPKSVAQFEYECNQRHNYKYRYNGDYTGSKNKITIICQKHGKFKQVASSHKQGIGCPVCKASKGELKIAQYLTKHNIVFERQKHLDGCFRKRKLRFDFYLPKYNMCIEYDGMQHFKAVGYFNGQEKLDRTKETDEIKNGCCVEQKIKLIRIAYFDFKNIENILEKHGL